MIIIFSVFFCLILILSIVISHYATKSKLKEASAPSRPLTVIIPFKNEANRISPLIASLNSAELPTTIEFIFVDDHSDDQTVELLLDKVDINFKLIRLRRENGKKSAIRTGVEEALYNSILTLDADVSFSKSYLKSISSLPSSDLTILPVSMTGRSLLQKLASIEFRWLQSLTFFSAEVGQPILCNGANLTFNKSAFLDSESIRNDNYIPSGDDVFLLQAMQKLDKTISAYNLERLGVQTSAPDDLKTLANQRLRWILKLNNRSGFLAVFCLVFINILMIYAFFQIQHSVFWLTPVILKIISEWCGTNSLNIKTFFMVVLHQIYYPIYGLFLLGYMPFRSKW